MPSDSRAPGVVVVGTRFGCLTPVPTELEVPAPAPPPADLLDTAHDMLHSTGIDFGPWTRMAETFRDLILGREVPADPPPATFADGLALTQVIDAIRRSAAERVTVDVPS